MILKAAPFPSGVKGTVVRVVPFPCFHICTKQSPKDLGVLDVLGMMTGVIYKLVKNKASCFLTVSGHPPFKARC